MRVSDFKNVLYKAWSSAILWRAVRSDTVKYQVMPCGYISAIPTSWRSGRYYVNCAVVIVYDAALRWVAPQLWYFIMFRYQAACIVVTVYARMLRFSYHESRERLMAERLEHRLASYTLAVMFCFFATHWTSTWFRMRCSIRIMH